MSNNHGDQTDSDGIHIVYAFVYSNSAQRLADSRSASDKGKIALQTDSNSFWILNSAPNSWTQLDTAGGVAASIPAPDYVATSNIALTGSVAVDGATPATGKIVLATAQTNAADRLYWIANTAGAWTLASFNDTDAKIAPLLGISSGAVTSGSLGVGSFWYLESGTTLAGAKVWKKVATPSLLQDALGATLPAQTLTQHKGAAILKDPTNGRNTVDHDRRDIREFGANPNGKGQTTVTAAGTSGAVTLGGAITGLQVYQWLFLHQLGAAHGMTTPGAPQVIAQGVTGARTVSIKFVALTSTHGYTAAGPATTINVANAAIGIQGADYEYLTYVEAWPTAVAGAYKYLAYVQFDGAGSYTYAGGVIAYPLFDADGNVYPLSFRLVSASLPAPPEGIPTTAPSADVPNGLRTQVTAMASTTSITVSPAPISTGTSKVATLCSKLPIEDAMQAISYGFGSETRIPFGTFYCTGDLEIDCPTRFTGPGSGRSQSSSIVFMRDGHGVLGCDYRLGVQRQPATLYRLGDRVVASLRTGAVGCWTATAIAAGKTWGLSATGGDPTWNYTTGGTTTDGEITWTFQSVGYLTSGNGAKIEHVAFVAAGKTIPAQRSVAFNDLRLSPRGFVASSGGIAYFSAGASYTLNQWVLPTTSNASGKAYKCTTAGTTVGAEGTWGRTNGGTTTQGGTAVFTCFDMRQVQGAGFLQMMPMNLEYVEIMNFCGTGLYLEGNSYSNGGSTNVSRARGCDIRGNSGHAVVVQGSDGNGFTMADCSIGVRTANAGSCAVQDNSFYGAQLKNIVTDGAQRYQFQPWSGSAQCMAIMDHCYIEGDAPGDADGFAPAKVFGGNLRLRPGSTMIQLLYSPQPSLAFNSPVTEYDPAGIERVLTGGFERFLIGVGTVQGGTVLQEETGGITVDGRSYTKIINGAAITRMRDHYGARGYCEIYPNGIRVGAGGFTQETIITSVTAVPTAGLFKIGDVYIWSLDNSRLEIRPSRTGNLGGAPRANSTPYVRGDIITTGGKAFRCTVPGTSAASLPAAFAAASIGTQVNDGATSLWHCWGTAQDPNLYGLPNWSVPPVAIADGNYTGGSGKALADGPVFNLAAPTANRTIDLLTTGAILDDGQEWINNNNVAFTVTFNSGPGGSLILTLPVNTPCKVRFKYNGTAWTIDSFQLVGASPRLNPQRTVAGTTDSPTAADQATVVNAGNAALTTFTLDSMPANTSIIFYALGAGGLTFANGTATLETPLASNGLAVQYQRRVAYWRTPTNVSIG